MERMKPIARMTRHLGEVRSGGETAARIADDAVGPRPV
jgi:hypothetical protein